MSELKQLKQLSQVEAANVGGGEADCPATTTLNTGLVEVSSPPASFGDSVISTYEEVIQATSYAIERVINAVNGN